MQFYRFRSKEPYPKLEAFLEDARRLGIRFVQQKEGSIDDFLENSMRSLNAMWEGE